MLPHFINKLRADRHEQTKDNDRSPQWTRVKKAFLATNGVCAACGGDKELQVHHIQPFHLFPALELVPSNLITLCMAKRDCHLLIGHGDNFKCYNPNVVSHAAAYKKAATWWERRKVAAVAKRERLK